MAEARRSRQPRPYGAWDSPISARDVAEHAWRPAWAEFVGGELWWTMPTPAEGGRVRLFRESDGADRAPVLPEPWNVRTAFTEYGGKPFTGYRRGGGVGGNDGTDGNDGNDGKADDEGGPVIVFTEWSDQRLYMLDLRAPETGPRPRPLTPEPAFPSALRYADPFVVAARGEVWCLREELRSPDPADVRRAIVAVPLDGSGEVRVLIDGARTSRFLANPRLCPDGRALAWIGWDHPDMPWDSAALYTAPLESEGVPGEPRRVAGGDGVSVAQAEWLTAATLLYAGDESGWWNLHTVSATGTDARHVLDADEEFAGPLWQPGERWFAPLGADRVLAIHGRTVNALSVYHLSGHEPAHHLLPQSPDSADCPYTDWSAALVAGDGRAATFAAGTQRPYELVTLETTATATTSRATPGSPAASTPPVVTVVSPAPPPCGEQWLPRPTARTFTGRDGREIHANVSAPRNPGFRGPEGERPPFVVFVHGGPTGRAPLVHDLEIAYFTSRGIGVVDVEYGGSTGHGRAYRERLRGGWGLVDVEDCAEVVRALTDEGTADPARVGIRGGSAGGWTTACALAADPGAARYCCGTIRFPVLDPVLWRTGGTHDLESHYLDGLIGPWPQAEARYRERSPLENAGRIAVPFLLLQGLQDAVCPPEQTRVFLDRVSGGKTPFAYLAFEGEQHGFRRAETIVAALEAELSLYGQAMGFDPPGVPRLVLGT